MVDTYDCFTYHLVQYFVEVHGSPRKKQEIVQDVTCRFNLLPEKCLFIGDAMTDYEAAVFCGTFFLGIVKKTDCSPFPEGTVIASKMDVYKNW